MSTMLQIRQMVYEQIKATGAAAYPHEGCGLLLGRMAAAGSVAEAALPVPNRWPVEAEKGERFRIDSEDMLRAELTAMRQGLDIIGVFHSHPDCPPAASKRDLAWAAWVGYSYLITRVDEGMPAFSRSWQLLPDRSGFVEEQIKIIAEKSNE